MEEFVMFLEGYWWVLVICVGSGVVVSEVVRSFVTSPSSVQLAQVKEWLLYAVVEAEKALGRGTGQVKLRYVYDMFLLRFPWLVAIISFEHFSSLVDEVLEKAKDVIDVAMGNLQEDEEVASEVVELAQV